MPKDECPLCFKKYNNQENKPYILTCGDTMCLKCINYYKEALGKETFECPDCCCKDAKSSGIFNKNVPLNNKDEINQNSNTNNADGFFDLIIREKNGGKFNIKVKKEYTIKKVKEIIKTERNIQENYELAFKSPLLDDKTLEFYKITSTVTITQISNLKGGLF